MRARRRRSVLNTISAAALEVAIMGIFVIIAQPQLRDALFEILHAGQPIPAATSTASTRPSSAAPAVTLDRTVQAVINSPVGQAIESSLSKWSAAEPANGNVPSTSAVTVSNGLRDRPAQNHLASYKSYDQNAYDQYEAFRVSVPTSIQVGASQGAVNQGAVNQGAVNQAANLAAYNSATYQQPGANGYSYPASQQPTMPQYSTSQYSVSQYSASPNVTSQFSSSPYVTSVYGSPSAPSQYVTSPYAIPQYVPPQNYGNQAYAPTQLNGNQWNIASAGQLPRPAVNAGGNNWIPSQVTETSFRQIVPPPYGTQSMWK